MKRIILLSLISSLATGVHANIIDDVGNTVKSGFNDAKNLGEGAVSTLKEGAEDAANQIKNTAQGAANQVRDIGSQVADQIKGTGEQIGKGIGTAAGDVLDEVKKIGNKIKACGEATALGTTIPPVIITAEILSTVLQVVKNTAGTIKTATNVALKIGDKVYNLSQHVLSAIQATTIQPSSVYAHVDLKHPKDTEFMFEGKVFNHPVKVKFDPFNPKKSMNSLIHAGMDSVSAVKGAVSEVAAAAA